MQTYYDLKPICNQIHQEKLQEAENQRLARQAKTNREPQDGLRRIGLAWSSTLTLLLHGVRTAGQAIARARKGTA